MCPSAVPVKGCGNAMMLTVLDDRYLCNSALFTNARVAHKGRRKCGLSALGKLP